MTVGIDDEPISVSSGRRVENEPVPFPLDRGRRFAPGRRARQLDGGPDGALEEGRFRPCGPAGSVEGSRRSDKGWPTVRRKVRLKI